MKEKKPAVVYSAVYDDEATAPSALEVLEALYEEEWIGDYDAAVYRMKLGEPHIVRRVDHPRISVIPELIGHGALPENELRKAADELPAGKVGLMAVGEVSLERAFEDAVTGAARSAQREFTMTTDRLASELIETFKTNAARGGR